MRMEEWPIVSDTTSSRSPIANRREAQECRIDVKWLSLSRMPPIRVRIAMGYPPVEAPWRFLPGFQVSGESPRCVFGAGDSHSRCSGQLPRGMAVEELE